MSDVKAAAAIVDIWMGGDQTWRSRLDDSDFLESADWQNALELARAVIEATRPEPSPHGDAELVAAAAHIADKLEELLPFLETHSLQVDGLSDAIARVRVAGSAASGDPELVERVALLRRLLDCDFGDESDHCIELAVAAGQVVEHLTAHGEPMLTAEETDELVERINANPNLQPSHADAELGEAADGLGHVADALREVHALSERDPSFDAMMLGQIAAVERGASLLRRAALAPHGDAWGLREAASAFVAIAGYHGPILADELAALKAALEKVSRT